MKTRVSNNKLVEAQETLRLHVLTSFYGFDNSNFENVLKNELLIDQCLKKLTDETVDTSDAPFFKNYSLIIQTFFHLMKWSYNEFNANGDGLNHLQAAKRRAALIDITVFDQIGDFKARIRLILQKILDINAANDLCALLREFIEIPFPRYFSFDRKPFSLRGEIMDDVETETKSPPLVLFVELNIEGDPWANPHILKPNVLYNVTGQVTINHWPEGYDGLALLPISSLPQDSFSVTIAKVVFKRDKLKYELSGTVLFKYPQSTLDDTIAIKLLAIFEKAGEQPKYPTVVGYHQLIVKVVDANSPLFITGFKAMNKVLSDVATRLPNELPGLDDADFQNFVKLLNGVLSYQGFCAQRGAYKGIDTLKESEFRDKMIEYLTAQPNLGENIIKEPSVAGGNIEIVYNGIIAELKVETAVSDRTALAKKYGKQPTQYASGNGKQLSILVVLDLTEKQFPSAAPQNNVNIIVPTVHGFESSEPSFPSRVVLVVIDGNTKNPSDYNK
jgi:hypothetical protein